MDYTFQTGRNECPTFFLPICVIIILKFHIKKFFFFSRARQRLLIIRRRCVSDNEDIKIRWDISSESGRRRVGGVRAGPVGRLGAQRPGAWPGAGGFALYPLPDLLLARRVARRSAPRPGLIAGCPLISPSGSRQMSAVASRRGGHSAPAATCLPGLC